MKKCFMKKLPNGEIQIEGSIAGLTAHLTLEDLILINDFSILYVNSRKVNSRTSRNKWLHHPDSEVIAAARACLLRQGKKGSAARAATPVSNQDVVSMQRDWVLRQQPQKKPTIDRRWDGAGGEGMAMSAASMPVSIRTAFASAPRAPRPQTAPTMTDLTRATCARDARRITCGDLSGHPVRRS